MISVTSRVSTKTLPRLTTTLFNTTICDKVAAGNLRGFARHSLTAVKCGQTSAEMRGSAFTASRDSVCDVRALLRCHEGVVMWGRLPREGVVMRALSCEDVVTRALACRPNVTRFVPVQVGAYGECLDVLLPHAALVTPRVEEVRLRCQRLRGVVWCSKTKTATVSSDLAWSYHCATPVRTISN